jgi:hypothetical protein
MSETYDAVDLSLAYNQGNSDAWDDKPPKPAPPGSATDIKHQSYRRGHAAGLTAQYYYKRGYAAGRADG